MRKHLGLRVAAAVILGLLVEWESVRANDVTVEICQFKDGKPAAVSLTFDDGLLDHYTVARPMLKAANIRATFFIVPAWAETAPARRDDPTKCQYMSWDQVRDLVKDGHEIGNHAYSHANLRGARADVLERQVVEPIDIIKRNTGLKPITFCFPGNARDERALEFVLRHHIAARTYQFAIGRNFGVNKINTWLTDLISRRTRGVAMIHAIVARYNGYDPMPNEEKDLKALLDLLRKYDEQLWVDTFANISKYEKMRESAHVHWLDEGSVFELKTNLDTTLYNIPLTVKITRGGENYWLEVRPNTPIRVNDANTAKPR